MQGHRGPGRRHPGDQVARRLPAQVRVVAAGDNGNLQSQTIQIPGVLTNTQSYAYDGVNRLSTFTEAGAQLQTYSYDAYGNRWLTGGSFIPYSTHTPQSNNFTNNQWAPGAGVSYDLAGNQTSLAVGSGTRSFSYDAENRQITASIPGMSAISYAYDGEGRRVQKTVGTTVTTYVYDAEGNLAAEYGGPGSSVSGTTYLTADHLGSTRLVTNLVNGSPNPVERYDYAPFGEELTAGIDSRISTSPQFYSTNQYPTITSDSLTEKFTGKERDAETGLDFFEARYYSSAQGRFTSPDEFKGGFLDAFTGQAAFQPDPLPYADLSDPQTLNKYAYVRNNPLRYTDPNGHCIWDLCIGEGAAVYAAGAATVTAAAYLMTPQGKESARAAIEGLGLLIDKAADGIRNLVSPPPSTPTDTQIQTSQDASTLQPGPHAGDSIPARGPQRDFTPGERGQVNDIGNTTGCHTCGTTTPGTKSGNFVPDHQPPSGVNTNNAPQRLYPQCLNCSRQQGGEVRQTQRTQPPPPPRPVKKPEDGSN